MSCDFGVFTHFYQEKVQKARKPHVCGECSREIQPGETYVRVIGKYDNDFVETKQCMECNYIYGWADSVGYCVGQGTLWEDVYAGLDGDRHPKTEGGFDAFKERVIKDAPSEPGSSPELAILKLYDAVRHWEESDNLARERGLTRY